MSDSSSTSSSWTLLAAEENVVEPLGSVAEGVEHHADTLDPATVETIGDMGDGKDAVSAERDRSEDRSKDSWQSPQEVDMDIMMDVISHEQHDPNLTPDPAHDPNLTPDPAHDPNLTPDPAHDPNLTSDPAHDPNLTPDPAHDPNLTPDLAHDPHMALDPAHDPHMTPNPTSLTNEHLSSSLEVPAHCNPDHDTASHLEGSSESQAPPTPDPDSFSESYTHISPSTEESSDFLLPAETLGAEKLTEEEEELRQEGEAAHHLSGEGLGQEGEESELSQRVTEDRKQEVPTVGEESGVRKRRGSLLAALERIDRQDEEEEEPEDFRMPQREEEIGFSLNKCILGAIILLGLGTIFFSGVFMDLDEEEEYDVRQMRDTELTGTQAWLNPDVPPPPVDVDNPELLSGASEGSLHDTMLHAQLQAQKEQLKVALGPEAEERVRREEQEEEEGLLLKENDQMKRDLASVPALQREVETLRATVTQLKHRPASDAPPAAVSPSAAPPSGPGQDGSLNTDSPAEEEGRTTREGEGKEEEEKKEGKAGREWMKDEPERGKREKGWKERGEEKQKDGEKKDWKLKKEKQDDGDVQGWKKRKEKKGWKEEKTEEWKKERESRGDDGKPWRNREDEKDGGRKDERKDWKKSKKENKGVKWQEDRKEGREEGKEKKEEWKHEKGWGEKRREEEKEWTSDKDWKKGDVKKDGSREWKSKEKERPWQGREEERTRERDGKKGREEERIRERDRKKGREEERTRERDGKKGREEERTRERDRKKGREEERIREGDRKKGREEERIRERDRKKGREEERIRERDRKKGREEESWRHEVTHKHKDQHKHKHDKREHRPHGFTEREGGKRERLWEGPGETSPPHTHRRPPLEQPNYWLLQRERLQRNPSPQTKCTSVEACAQAEGLLPVPLPEFEALLLGYLAKAEGVGVSASRMEELRLLATDFFRDGVFTHDQMSFRDFVEDLADILEDMVEGEEDEDEEEDEEEEGGIEDEMEGFDDEAMRRFAVPGGGEKVERKRGEKMKEAGRAGG